MPILGFFDFIGIMMGGGKYDLGYGKTSLLIIINFFFLYNLKSTLQFILLYSACVHMWCHIIDGTHLFLQ